VNPKEFRDGEEISSAAADHSVRRTGFFMFVITFVGVIALFTWLSSDYLERRFNPNQGVEGRSVDGSHEITLQANRNGHYVVQGLINQEEVTFFVDTGATTVSIPAVIADRLNLARGMSVQSQTAAGVIENFMTRLDSVALGPIVLRNVRATINPHSSSEYILLGMSFLGSLELVQKDRELLIRQ